ncbi:MAG: 16S rRNA (cytosine(967)-C(5))-methyltransferase RsmB [Thermaerobacter sp.]|nr:16S rRNA (cytosine(967)-C(5))-methyltransferase RsmB [Thermaerobacter sp.]
MNHVAKARQLALDALTRARQGLQVSDAIRTALRGQNVTPADRALMTQLVYGALRHRRFLDAWIRPWQRGPLDPEVQDILRMAFFQIGFLDRVPTYAAVNEAVEQTKTARPRAAATVNAILRRGIGHRPDGLPLAVRYSHPDWLVARWERRFGRRVQDILEADNRIPPLTVRVNPFRTTRAAVLKALQDLSIAARPSPYLPEAVEIPGAIWLEDFVPFQAGWVTVQDTSGMLVRYVLDPKPRDRVLDLAAGLGSKTTHLAERTPEGEVITAVDVSASRLALLAENLARLGLAARVRMVHGDARVFAQQEAGQFDRVLIDVPCSGLGVLRRRVDARWRKREDDFAQLARLQGELLDSAVTATRPGGVIVYSACSIEPEETVEVISEALNRRPDLGREPLESFLPHPDLRGAVVDDMFLSLPGQFDMDGFFICRLKKR